jgi:DNA polymerase-3 subunit delta
MGAPGTVDLKDAEACVGDSAAISMDELAHAVSAGDHAGLEASLVRARLAGSDAVRILRAVSAHFLRLHRAVGLAEKGRSPEQAMKALRPPVFFKFAARFRTAMGRWQRERLARALVELAEAELACKTTGAPADLLCSRALMRVAHAA